MNIDGIPANNTAGAAGIQAGGDVHDSNVYLVGPDDPPERRYTVGVKHLEDGLRERARELLADVMAHGYDGNEVRFHRVLALLSGRAYRDLSADEREQLARIERCLGTFGDDEWNHALKVIYELLACLRDRKRDPGPVLKDLRSLDTVPHHKIVHHLDHVLTGSMKDSLWAGTRQRASEDRLSKNRQDRVWAYFEPIPINPRVRPVIPKRTTVRARLIAVGWSVLLAASAGHLGWLVLAHAAPLSVVAYLIAVAAGYVGARTGLDWHYRWRRLRIKDREYFGDPAVNRAPAGGFADNVSHRFDHYFAVYVPKSTNREEWLAATVGIKRSLRDEIVELYREKRVRVGRVDWLIRYLVARVSQRWENGTLWQYRERYKVQARTKVWCVASLGLLVAATLVVVVTAARGAPVPTIVAALVLLLSSIKAARQWFDIVYDRRRHPEDEQELTRCKSERDSAFERWQNKLRAAMPTETEMETWLSCDMTLVLDEALEHYRLAWRDVLAHAFLRTPAKDCQKARVNRGPWRYSEYNVRLFLVTQDGVRELCTLLDFSKITFRGQERNNYRFEAVSSVYVLKRSEYSYRLELTLTNGPSQQIHVTDLEVQQAEPDEDPSSFARMNLDSAGFTRTLHILEGIAAEGKGWIDRDPHNDEQSSGRRAETDVA